jgi:hypothetical protein
MPNTKLSFYKSLGNPAFYPMEGHRYLVTIADETQGVEVTLVEPAMDIDDDLVTFRDRDGRIVQTTAEAFIEVLGATATGVHLVRER